ncbi:MAG: SGNH/GDSL hydrolase family protein [Chloroflexi bacterium]|nr:SGNH/GDSL hydrolase family protein [Chloroflexota bacterium]
MQRNISVNDWDRFLPRVLILAGAGITAIALAADYLDFGGPPGIGPNQFSLALSGFAVLLAGVVLISSVSRRYIGEWLLVGAAVIAVAFAADLVVINGLPDFGAKFIVLASIGLGVLLTGVAPASSVERRNLSSWLNLFSLDRLKLSQFLSLGVQLGLLVLMVRQFRLENQALYHNVMLLTFYGFLIHYFLPVRYRLPFFLLLSLAAIAGILGFVNGAWLIAIGLGLVGICHLPVSYLARVAILLVAGAALVALRVNWIQASGLDVIWPVLASMFMFRLIIYVYDLKHSKATPTLASTLSYFFLLPNVVFPFFPVIDYGTFRRTYYDDDQHRIYQKGLQWMLRGVIHLIIYRYVNYYLVIAPEDVTNTAELVRYLISNFGLYLRISGQFHLIIGLLHLFGFNLPETHHLYFLASSFTDLWRRINIYWKDFMMKVFYYPTYFRIRQWGATLSLVFATSFVFFLTWFFHAYQWFWLRGSFLLTAQDLLFWFILALLVVANTLYEAKRGRKRTLGQRSLSMGDIAGLALRSAATFGLMAVLWSLWSSDSIRDWISLLSVVEVNWENIAALILVFLVIVAVFSITIWITAGAERTIEPNTKPFAFFRSAAVTGGSVLLLFLIGNPVVYSPMGGKAQELISDLTVNRLSDREAALLQQGYYEDLVGVDRFNSQLWEIYTKRPSEWLAIRDTEAVRPTNDNLILELVPSTTIDFNGTRLSTNRWGMRDRDYEQTPAPGTYRIALTGPSFVMGLGVADDEGFEWLLEDRLNREQAGSPYARYEILNFAVPGYSALQELIVLEQKGLSFQPNALFFMAHQREEEAVVLYLADRISVGADLPYEDLMELARRAGVEAGATKVEAERLLKPFETEILSWTYRRIVEVSRAYGILPVWIFMPTLENPLRDEEVAHLAGLAEESGFIVLNLSDAYENQDVESLVVAYWDKHPNAKGHRLIAERLYQALQEKEEAIPLFQ